MYRLFVGRVINSKPCDILMREFSTLESAASYLYGVYFLTAYCLDESGNRYELIETEYFDEELDADCVRLSFSNKGL